MLSIANLDEAVRIFHDPARHHELAGQCLQLPDWFDHGFDPETPEFRAQQLRLWREITQREIYDPLRDEDTPEIAGLDPIFRPGFYSTGSAEFAGFHLLALSHLLLRSGVTSGMRVIEYGAGFAQNALAFARIGAKVDTVDISAGFCGAVRTLADWYKVDLTPHHEAFGYNPAGLAHVYDLVLFYESFHHCLEFETVIPQIAEMLKPEGRVLMAVEPIVRHPQPLMPYDWGIRLDWKNVAIMRHRGWMELGFREEFLVRQFRNFGFNWNFFPDTGTAQVYEFKPWTTPIQLGQTMMTLTEEQSWFTPDTSGRWTTARSILGIPSRQGEIEVTMRNYHNLPRYGHMALGAQALPFRVEPGEYRAFRIPQDGSQGQRLVITSNVARGNDIDTRDLGIFVETISPV